MRAYVLLKAVSIESGPGLFSNEREVRVDTLNGHRTFLTDVCNTDGEYIKCGIVSSSYDCVTVELPGQPWSGGSRVSVLRVQTVPLIGGGP